MKTYLKISFCSLLVSQICFAQWFWQNPLPQGNDLRDVWVLNQNTVFAVGDKGTLLRSTNAGVSWQITHKLAGISENIVDIQFVTGQKGWLLANKYLADDYGNMIHASSKVLLTVDGGMNWNRIASFDSLRLNDLCFMNENVGWAVGYSATNIYTDTVTGMVFRTSDGGHNWQLLYESPATNQRISAEGECIPYLSIHFIDQYTGWVAGRNNPGELLRTTDGGLNWNVVNNSRAYIKHVQFVNSSRGWLIETYYGYGTGYSVSKTVDGGVSWQTVFFKGDPYCHLPSPSLYFVSDSLGWISEPAYFDGPYWVSGRVHKTTDGGTSWLTDTLECPGNSAIHFGDSMTGYVVGMCGQILSTHDGGLLWSPRSTIAFRDELTAVDFCSGSTGWVTGHRFAPGAEESTRDAVMFKTSDGGSSWTQQLYLPGAPMYTQIITDIHALSDQIVYAHGEGTHKTTNGGASWIRLGTLGTGPLYGPIHFIDQNTGFRGGRVGDYPYTGEIQKTTNGGTAWNTVLSASHTIRSMSFAGTSDGWAGGDGDIVYRTTDAGNTWQGTTVGIINLTLNSVFFFDRYNGWAAGYAWGGVVAGGLIIRTTNSGSNWHLVYVSQGRQFNSICFTDLRNGFVVSSEGDLLSTSDGGTSWYHQFEGSAKSLNDIVFVNGNTGWVVGNDGTILHTANGGNPVPVELNSFSATANGKEVTLDWSTATELNNQGFEVQRKFGSNDFVTIGSVKGNGTTTSPNNYTYIDKLFDAGKYFYRLKQIDYGGKYEYSQEVEVNWSPFITYKLEQNYPNPFNPTTTIGFGIPEKGNVRLSILNLLGEEIRVLMSGEKEAGYHSIDFNASGFPSGVYFYQLKAGKFVDTRKMILLR